MSICDLHGWNQRSSCIDLYQGMFVDWTRTRWNSREYHTPQTLIKSTKKHIAFHGAGARVREDFLVVRGLDAGFQGVEGVDDEVDNDCGEGAGLFTRGMVVSRWYRAKML